MLLVNSDKSILVVICLFTCVLSVVSQDVNTTIIIPLNKSITYDDREIYSNFIELESTVQVKFSDIDTHLYFIVFQVHTQFENITVYKVNDGNVTVTGTNVGLINILKKLPGDTPTSDIFFIQNPNQNVSVRAYISVHGYIWQDPIPGGCNLEWSPPLSPFLKTRTMSAFITVEAASPSIDADCNMVDEADITFHMMYQSEMNFNSDVYFTGLRNMMTLKNIEKYGTEIPQTHLPSRRMLSAYHGLSVVFVAVARRNDNQSLYSVYVPGHSYGCPEVNEDGCMFADDFVSAMLCTILLFGGLFMSIFGHRFFKTEMFLSGFFSGFIITYILVILMDDGVGTQALVAASVLSGIFFGAIWLLFWWLYGIPVVAVLLPALNAGFICAAIFYYKLPATISYFQNDFNFWTVFVMIMVLSATAMAFVTHSSSILCCAFLGGFCTMYAFDYYLGSNLKYIIVNTVRRAVVENFSEAVLAPPFMTREILVTLLWIFVSSLGWLFQLWDNKGRPPFPPPPRSTRLAVPESTMYGAVTDYARRLYPQGVTSNTQSSGSPILARPNTERTPLMSGTNN
ncbi:unnamed protein product [Arctia plantaginis]|uniref:TM7S3/TM198-like domain-containing protein n=1 Tax=Arctia plantaginis TaxID=874455 RepID=A0A8S0ZH48_ARCPL|nr:unnamed protein product [Arctia plantaginis]